MITRLKVNGFKNLVDVDVRFGPFTCIAGANAVGKSNLFDAIMFLSALADKTLIDAAKSVREEDGRSSDIRGLFHCVGKEYDKEMTFQAEMIVPKQGIDDLGQDVSASITFLRYTLKLGYRTEIGHRVGGLELLYEELIHFNQGDAAKHLLFPHKAAQWRKSAVQGERRGGPFISTEGEGGERIIKMHQDGGSRGKPRPVLAVNLPRTVLSTANAAETPTALMARREMQSWRLLQLEPSALRKWDEINAPTKMGAGGSHLAATLYHLATIKQNLEPENQYSISADEVASIVYSQVANRLAELIDDVRDVSVDYDEKRESLTVMLTGKDGTPHSARSLSDGTLRFLALAVLELDMESTGVICLEEPENGIHPERIPAILSLLKDIATDVEEPIGPDNPLRQVIVNTHSPAVVGQIHDDCLLVADRAERIQNGNRFKSARFSCLSKTWRQKAPEEISIVSRGALLSYLNPVAAQVPEQSYGLQKKKTDGHERMRVADRIDVQPYLPCVAEDK